MIAQPDKAGLIPQEGLKMNRTMDNPVIDWLLEPCEPGMRYRTLRELLDAPADDPEVIAAREGIPASQPVIELLEKMHPDGYWLQKTPSKDRWVGDGVEYGSFATTHFCLAYLSELGMDRTHPQVALAAERYLGLQQPDGDWLNHYSCLYGYNIRTFLLFGYRDDPRVQKSLQMLEEYGRKDGGYLCDWHEPPALRSSTTRRKPKSCIRGSLKALAAFSEAGPQYWDHPACQRLLGYFLDREGIFQRQHPQELVNKDIGALNFPFIWRASLVEVLYHLSRMGHGSDPRLERAWQLLRTKAGSDGRYILDWTPTQCPWKVGSRGAANKWLTFYALLAMKLAGRLN